MTADRPPGTTDLDFIRPGDIPYLSCCPIFGRKIILLPLHDGFRFHVFIPQKDGTLMVVQPLDMSNGHYVARAPAADTDVKDELEEIVFQSYSYPSFIDLVRDMHSDALNSLASLHRYFVLLRYANEISDLAEKQLIATELEYAFANHRAFFDLLARALNLFRSEPEFSGAELPESFRKIVQKPDEELISKFGMPTAFVNFVRSREKSFFALRAIRDGIYHRGETIGDIIFTLPDGFGLGADAEFLKKLEAFALWPAEKLKYGRIASLLPVFELLTRDILETSSHFATLMAALSGRPASIAEQFHVYLRSSLTLHIRNLPKYRDLHWIVPEDVLQFAPRAAPPNSP